MVAGDTLRIRLVRVFQDKAQRPRTGDLEVDKA